MKPSKIDLKPSLAQDLPERDAWLPPDTAYTAARSARLNAAILLRLSELSEEDLRRFHRVGVAYFDVRAVALDRIEPACVVLSLHGRPAVQADAADPTIGMTPLPIWQGLESFAHYERNELGLDCRDLPMEELARNELLQIYASFLVRAYPIEALDDEWSRVFTKYQ